MSLSYKQHWNRQEESQRDLDIPSHAELGKRGADFSLAGEKENVNHGESSEPIEAGGGASRLESGNRISRTPSADIHDKAKEKKKRSRVTPMQLAQLEQFFATDRNPTATRRKEISQALGMQERQTQIWFQNRRAKAKLQEGKQRSRTIDTHATEDSPLLTNERDVNFCDAIYEELLTLIPCTSLTIGTWRRMASEESHFDLVAYICEPRQCLMWFLQSDGWAFKMAIHFSNIIDTTFVDDRPGFGILSLYLSRPPQFFLYDCCQESSYGWKPCSDWTEGCQASRILRHDLSGEIIQMAGLRQYIFQAKTVAFDHPLQKPVYPPIPAAPSLSQSSIGIPHRSALDNDEEKRTLVNVKYPKTAQFTAEGYSRNTLLQCPSHSYPDLRSYQNVYAGDISSVNDIAQNTMPLHHPFEAESPCDLSGPGGYFNARGEFVMQPRHRRDHYDGST